MRPAGPGVEAIDDVRSTLVADIVAGDLIGPITRSDLARRYKTASAALQPARWSSKTSACWLARARECA